MSDVPYHIEAKKLGVKNFKQLLKMKKIFLVLRDVWDYEAHNLNMGEARAYLFKWSAKTPHRKPPEEPKNRILNMKYRADANRKKLDEYFKDIEYKLYIDDGSNRYFWKCNDTIIKTTKCLSSHRVVGRNGTYTKKKVCYYSQIINKSSIPTRVLGNLTFHGIIQEYIENSPKFFHNKKGNWRNAVAKHFNLGEFVEPTLIGYKKVLRIDSRTFVSIFNGKTLYILGETKKQRARTNHKGGFYFYKTKEDAELAEFPYTSVLLARKDEGVILKVRAKGPFIAYPNGKIACSEITPIEVV
jgi:hypothetical protein